MFDTYDELITVDEMQKLLGVGKNTAYELLNQNKIHFNYRMLSYYSWYVKQRQGLIIKVSVRIKEVHCKMKLDKKEVEKKKVITNLI